MDTALEAKLAEIVDRHEIYQVMLRYGRGLDRVDNELALSCYWDDATEDHGQFVGRPRDFVPWADGTTLRFLSTQHAILNHFCDLQGDDAYCESYYQFTGMSARGTPLRLGRAVHRSFPEAQRGVAHRQPGHDHRRRL